MPPADRAPGRGPKKPPRRRASSIRAAAATAAGSSQPQESTGGTPVATPRRRAGAAKRDRGTASRRQAGRAKGRSDPRKKARAAGGPATPAPLDIDDVGIVDVTAAHQPAPAVTDEPEIPDLAPPEGAGADEPVFPDYQPHSETWDPFEDSDAPGDRIDPDFDAQRTLGQWLEGVIPPDAQVHFIRAGSEFVKGVQVTVDHHAGRRPQGGPEHAGGPNRIEIE